MKKNIRYTVIVITALWIANNLNAQISKGGEPVSNQLPNLKSKTSISSLNLPTFNTIPLLAEDSIFPNPVRYAKVEEVDIDIKSAGDKTEINNKGNIWQFTIESPKAKSLQLYFKKFQIPPKASLFIYDLNYNTIFGAFTEANNNSDSTFSIADFPGNKLIIEYYEPTNPVFDGIVVLGSVAQAYKDIYNTSSSIDTAGLIGVNCPEGMDWINEKHAICLYSFISEGFRYLCSGSLLNNVNNDGSPYFLTANHCISKEDDAGTIVAYFNYEQAGCNGQEVGQGQTLSGATLLSTFSASDYSLLRFDNTPPESYQPYYAGWDASGGDIDWSIGIHHANGLLKKISFDYDPAQSYNSELLWEGNTVSPPNSHWETGFDAGITYEGSSGSPLFDHNRRIVGQLHGGDDLNEYYGKLSYSWTRSRIGLQPLKNYLDPNNTGTLTLNSYYPAANLPDPQMVIELEKACLDAPVQLQGYSAFSPNSWNWSFSPSTVTYIDGTSNTSKNPVVTFNESGNYNITLSAENNAGVKGLTMQNLVSAGNAIDLSIAQTSITDSCYCNIDSLVFSAFGANTFQWTFNNNGSEVFQANDLSLNPLILKKSSSDTDTVPDFIDISLVGSHGNCTDTSTFTFQLYSQTNDDIANAVEIVIGKNGPYSNKCAGIEENEPIPPYSSCTGQLSWCDEYRNGENIVEKSVWFYFEAQKSETLWIRSYYFDNQIAVYKANSYMEILNGDYELIGANDDYTADNPNPYIENLNIEAGSTYWVQIDGSGGGSEGEFVLYLSDGTSVEANQLENNLVIYPQPAKNILNVTFGIMLLDNIVEVSVYSLSGTLLKKESIILQNDSFQINVGDLPHGVYFISIETDKKPIVHKFIL